jgi:hypothetical protein
MSKPLVLFLLLTYIPALGRQVPGLPFPPEQYVCYRSSQAIIVDGKLTETAWTQAPWTADFGDIEGDKKPKPLLRTRAKILWDDTYLYIAAELEEPHVRAISTERESPLHEENAFEVFIDPLWRYA